ncbi:MAG: hypothetical protein M1829_005462 [Trizodia sp. TS-e1964]|nr:MAG: hypothetical protein M1829_005462 [Trizodia sp. TS-e1964]
MPAPLAKGIIITASILISAGIAVYQNPQVREFLVSSRRKIAFALYNLGDEINPNQQPSEEDAENGTATEAQRRQQREELMYWNLLREEKEVREKQAAEGEKRSDPEKESTTGTSHTATRFDDFLREDGEHQGTYSLYSSSANGLDDEGMRYRRAGRAAELAKHNTWTSQEEKSQLLFDQGLIGVGHDESFEHLDHEEKVVDSASVTDTATLSRDPISSAPIALLIDDLPLSPPADTQATPTLEAPLAPENNGSFSSVHEWAENTFYSPLAASAASLPTADELASSVEAIELEHELLDPADSASLAGSAEAIEYEVSESEDGGMDYISEVGGVSTPGSWSNVGSEVSGEH